jgi:threonine aldolase
VLVGPRDLIKKAVWFKKQQGGGIRQSGMLCAAARVAVDEVWPTMKQTHEKTKRLAEDIEKLGVTAQLPVDTNFIFLDAQSCGLNVEILVEEGAKRGIKLLDERIVLHHHTSDDSIEALKDAVHAALIASKGVPSRPNSASKVYRSHNMNGKN